jgi:hypothetical protein
MSHDSMPSHDCSHRTPFAVCAIIARMDDQIINAEMARSLHADAVRTSPLVGWIVMRDPPDHAGKFVARLVTAAASPYVLIADTLAEIHAALPPGLTRSDRQPADLPDVVEVWFVS